VSSVIGRRREFAEVEGMFESLSGGAGTVVFFGEAGIGKTTLWERALELGEERLCTVLSARAAQSELELTYVGLRDLLDSVPRDVLEQLPGPQRRALELALLQVDAADSADSAPLALHAVAVGCLSVLRALASAAPVVVAVDDVQWLDSSSADVLEFVARRVGPAQVVFLLAQRAGDPEPFPFERSCPRLVRVDIGPLDAGDLHEVIRARTGSSLTRRRLRTIERLSGGNPLFALELARGDWAGHGMPTVSTSLDEALRRRVGGLPPETRESLLAAALAARPTLQLVDPVALSVAEDQGMVRVEGDETITFTHPLLRWTILSSASLGRRRSAHARLSRLVTDKESRIRHRALAVAGPSAALAAELEEMASLTRARGAPASAADLLAQARRLTPAAESEAWARRAAAEIALRYEAGDWQLASELGSEAVRRLPPGPSRAAVLLAAYERDPHGRELCEQALAESGDDRALAARAHLSLAVQGIYALDPSAFAHVAPAVDLARELGDPLLLMLAHTYRGLLRFLIGVGDPMPDLEEAVRLENGCSVNPLPLAMSAPCYRALVMVVGDGAGQARPVLEAMLAQAVEAGDEASQAQLLSFLAMAELEAGNTIRARELIEESIALADLMEFTQGRAEKRVLLARILTWQGELDDARAAILESRSIWEKSGDTFTLVLTLAAAAQVAVAAGDTAGAVEQVTELRRLLHEGSLPPWTHFEGDELEALVGVGRTDEAKKRLLELDQRNCDHPSVRRGLWAARGGALILASEGDLAGALRHLEGALDSPRLDLTLVPLEHARTLLLKGRLERRTKHKAAASRTLEEAASLFDLLGARAWAERAQEEASRLGLRRPRQELTVTERRIAELAATGKTNQGIASELFISRRTVESNIARVYRKLNIRNRVELSNIVSTWTHGPLG